MRAYFLHNSPSILSVQSQDFYADLLPIKFCLVRVGRASRRDSLPLRKPFVLDDIGSWQYLAVAADTLESV